MWKLIQDIKPKDKQKTILRGYYEVEGVYSAEENVFEIRNDNIKLENPLLGHLIEDADPETQTQVQSEADIL